MGSVATELRVEFALEPSRLEFVDKSDDEDGDEYLFIKSSVFLIKCSMLLKHNCLFHHDVISFERMVAEIRGRVLTASSRSRSSASSLR